MPDIMHRLTISAPCKNVFAAITTAEGVHNWWTRDADLESRPGGIGEFHFGHYGPEHTHRVRVIEVHEGCRLTWEVLSSFLPAWTGTTISFDLQPDGEATILRFAHRGYAVADDVYAMCTTGWGYYMVSLQQYVETGKGAPSPDVDFSRMLQ